VGKIGGGVLVAVKSNIHVTRRMDLERENVELVVEFATQSNKTALLLSPS
jgi:Holliday junction resolvase